jgi:hypothetical protein
MNPTVPDDTVQQPSPVRLTETERHAVLSADRRRVALDVLGSLPTPVSLDSLAESIAARETRSDAPERETVESVAVTLHHNHLPRLADVGLIEYDAASGRIE